MYVKNYLYLVSPITCFGLNVICQVYISRYVFKVSLLKSIFVGFIIGISSLLGIELYYLTHEHLFSLHNNLSFVGVKIITYSALGYCYFHFINLGETARRIRLLRELYDSRKGLSLADILKRYNANYIIDKRLERLLNSGQIIYKDDRYYINSSIVLLMARIIVAMKLLLLGKRRLY